MADLVISKLKKTAEEAREILERSLARFAPADNLYDAIQADVAPLGGVEFFRFSRQLTSEYPFSDIDDEPNDGE